MVAVAQQPTPGIASLDPYGQLIKMMLPRAQTITVYNSSGEPLWVSGGQDDPDLRRLAGDVLDAPPGLPNDIEGSAQQFGDAMAYAFLLRDAQGAALAVAALLARETGSPRPTSLVLGLLRPALECLQRDLALHVSLGAMSRDLSSRDRDLELFLDASVERADTPRDADELGRLVQAAVDHLGCRVGTLIIPERSVAVVRMRRGLPHGAEVAIITRTHRHLMAWAQLQRRTMIVNRVAPVADKVPPLKILSVPVRHLSNRVIGFLALFNRPDGPDFELRETRLAELLARKITSILLTSYDVGTGLLTRGAFEQQVDALIAGRTTVADDSVVYLDIDQMHVINENFGMHVGDETITKVAEVVRRHAPVGSLCARIAGDRFAIFMAGADAATAAAAAEVIRSSVADLSASRREGELRISLSAGIATLPVDSRHPLSHALATAEIASKTAKDRGRDRVETFDHRDVGSAGRHGDAEIVAGLRDALAKGRFRLYAQPILPLCAGGAEARFEILIRMLTESGELLPPSKFLPDAERHQLMPAIDRWVVERSLDLLGAHAGSFNGHAARFAINLSGQSLHDAAFAPFIHERLAASGIPGDLLCFELTEAAAIAHLGSTATFMGSLRSAGCHFALDDFGAGASSLAHLRSLPVTVLKIDGSFVRDALADARSESMVKALAQLARSMGITTVAEFIETDELRIRMTQLGVDYGQGFAIGKPLPLEEVLQELSLYELVAADPALDDPAHAADRVVVIRDERPMMTA